VSLIVKGEPASEVDPRVLRTRTAVLDTVAALLTSEGLGSISHQRVADESGVGRSTIYRHWPTVSDLLFDALDEYDAPLLRPRDEPLIVWLRAELRRAASELSTPAACQFVALLLSRADFDPAVAELRRRLLDRNVMTLGLAVARAFARGEIVAEPDPHELYVRLVGPVLMRVAIERRPATDAFVDQVIDDVVERLLPVVTRSVRQLRAT
jgi:AcrR family transcriptional regulator